MTRMHIHIGVDDLDAGIRFYSALFGLDSGAALATVVGVLVEVPVMLSLVGFANRTRPFFAW